MSCARMVLLYAALISTAMSACASPEDNASLHMTIESDAFVVSLKNESLAPIKIHDLAYGKHVELSFSSLRDSEEPWIRQFADAFDGSVEYQWLAPKSEKSTRIPFELVKEFVGLGPGCYAVSAKYYYTAPPESGGQNWVLRSNSVESCDLWVSKRPTR